MSESDKAPSAKKATSELRRTPVQKRSKDRVKTLKQAGRQVLREVGRDKITTAMVAARAGVSIGTFYRYYKDRIALLDAIWPDRRDTFPKPKKAKKKRTKDTASS